MKRILTLAAFLSAGIAAQAQVNWTLDKSHSKLGFAVSHLLVSETEGKFTDLDITATSKSETDFEGASVNLTIGINSVNTDDEKRDGHLKSPDFFDAEKFPKATFVSKSFKKVKGNQYKVAGDLTLRGVTKPVMLDVTYGGNAKDPWGNVHAGFRIKGKINRKDFGVNWSKAMDNGGAVVGDEVEIDSKIELLKK